MNLNYDTNVEEESPVRPSKAKRPKEKKKPVVKILVALAVCIALFLLTFSTLYNLRTVSGEKEFYYGNNFSKGTDGWQGEDMQWQESFKGNDGVLNLTKEEVMAPHSMSVIATDEVPTDSFVVYYSFYLSEFTGEATTLSTLVFPTTSLSIVVNDEGKIGIARDLFAKPVYSDYILADMETNTWEELYVYVDGKNDNLQIYHGDQKVLNETWEDPTSPLQEVWLGSIWLEGGGNYGSASQLAFDKMELGNEALLPQPTFFGFIATFFLDFITSVGNKLAKIVS